MLNVSIALCTYNGEQFIRDQLESIYLQETTPFELVVCDDCSTDRTLEILYSFKSKCKFDVRIYKNDINLGSNKNFEKAIHLCNGDIIALCDQDDVWRKDKLTKIIFALENNPDVEYVFSDAELVDRDLNLLGSSLWAPVNFTGKRYRQFVSGNQLLCLLQGNVVTGATMAFRSSLINLVLPIPDGIVRLHDGWIALIASSAGAKGLPLPEKLILYRQHGNQQTGVDPSVIRTNTRTFKETCEANKNLHIVLRIILHNLNMDYGALLKRLADTETRYGTGSHVSINFIVNYRIHLEKRLSITASSGYAKFKMLFLEAITGRYDIYSKSWRTVFRDLVM